VEQGRAHWVSEEMEILTSRATYDIAPADAWKRLKLRVRKPREFALLRMVAEWREIMARRYDVPRGRVIKDEAIYEICGHPPKGPNDLTQLRGLARGFDRGRYGPELLAVVKRALDLPKPEMPELPRQRSLPEGTAAATEMLKVLLKLIVERHGVAAKVIATADDLERIAADDAADVPALTGWRRELFGEHALALKHGQIALGFDGRSVGIIPIDVGSVGQIRAAE
jgi:ribonuclease D